MTFRLLDLFSGIGGFSLGLERSGAFKTVAFCEIEPFCRRVLAKHWPEVPCYDDVRTLTAERLRADGIAVDAICGGFPCQDISLAGNGAGLAGDRSALWFEYFRLVRELRPRVIAVENVAELLGRGMGEVLGTLASIGYNAIWRSIPASELGAPHPRDRIWIVAYPSGEGLEGYRLAVELQAQIAKFGVAHDVADAPSVARIYSLRASGVSAILDAMPDGPRWAGEQWPKARPCIRRVDDGIPDRVDRTSALGNAVVPQIPELIGRAIAASLPLEQERAA